MRPTFRVFRPSTSTTVRSTLGGLRRTSSSSNQNHQHTGANNANVSDDNERGGGGAGGGGESVYYPSAQDVLKVKEIIQEASNMPLELIDEIIDIAQYWACSFKRTLFRQILQAKTELEFSDCNLMVLRSMPLGYDPACGYLNTDSDQSSYQTKAPKPLFPDSDLSFLEPDTASVLEQWAKHSTPRGKNPCRKIVFTINSIYLGWGTRPDSYEWFDVGLERFTALKCSESEYRVQTNYQTELSYVAQRRLGGYWLLRPEGRAEWIASSAPLTNVQPSTNSAWGGDTTLVESSDPGKINPASILPPSPGNFLKYNLLTIIPEIVVPVIRIPYFKHPSLPPATCLQSLQINETGRAQKKLHVITWSFDDNVNPDSSDGDELEQQGRGRESMTGNFVRSLKLGDVVTVWANSSYMGWMNIVDEVKMDIYWAV